MKFGVFDHVDDSGLPLPAHLEARLRMAEAYDAAGFHYYVLATAATIFTMAVLTVLALCDRLRGRRKRTAARRHGDDNPQ